MESLENSDEADEGDTVIYDSIKNILTFGDDEQSEELEAEELTLDNESLEEPEAEEPQQDRRGGEPAGLRGCEDQYERKDRRYRRN